MCLLNLILLTRRRVIMSRFSVTWRRTIVVEAVGTCLSISISPDEVSVSTIDGDRNPSESKVSSSLSSSDVLTIQDRLERPEGEPGAEVGEAGGDVGEACWEEGDRITVVSPELGGLGDPTSSAGRVGGPDLHWAAGGGERDPEKCEVLVWYVLLRYCELLTD